MKSLSYLFTISLLLGASPLMAMDPSMDFYSTDVAKAIRATRTPYGVTPEVIQQSQYINWDNFFTLTHMRDKLEEIKFLVEKNFMNASPQVESGKQHIDNVLSYHALNIKKFITSYNEDERQDLWAMVQEGELRVWMGIQEKAFVLEAYHSENPKCVAPPHQHFIRTLEQTQNIVHREDFKWSKEKNRGIGFTAQEMKIRAETFDWGLYEELRSALHKGLFLHTDNNITNTAYDLLENQAFFLKIFLNLDHIPNLTPARNRRLKDNLSTLIQQGKEKAQSFLQIIADKTNPALQNPFIPSGRIEPVTVAKQQPTRPLPQPRRLPNPPIQANHPGNNPFLQTQGGNVQPDVVLPRFPQVHHQLPVANVQPDVVLPPPPVVGKPVVANQPAPQRVAPVVKPAQQAPAKTPAKKWEPVKTVQPIIRK